MNLGPFVSADGRLRRRTAALVAALVGVLIAADAAVLTAVHHSPATVSRTNLRLAAASRPWVGLLGAQDAQLSALEGSGGVSVVAVAAGWNTLEPTRNGFSADRLAALRDRIASVAAEGFTVVLDPGLQYPPSWVYDLPGQTRFVDQYGDVWHGELSTDVPNAVFNSHVRAAVRTYLTRLGAALKGSPIARVRIGGLLSGELRYPPASYQGHANLIWAYDRAAQAAAPVHGWRPGAGTADDAQRSLQYYFDSLTGYLTWQMTTVRKAFPTQPQEVLFPSWGLRPGMVDAAVNDGMHGRTNAEVNGMISAGLDWASQVRAVAATGIPADLSSTWLDAPQQSSSVQGIPPIAYLAQLAAPYSLGLVGENTGGGGEASLQLSLSRVATYGLRGMWYMSGTMIAAGTAGLTLQQMNSAAQTIAGS